LWLTLDAGHFDRVQFDERSGAVRIGLAAATAHARVGRLRVEQPARRGAATYALRQPMKTEREAYLIPLGATTAWVDLVSRR
jgi:hypothetical protein